MSTANEVRRDCLIFPELQTILRKSSGLADVLREALTPLAEQIESAFAFGSVAKVEERPGSDIDVRVVGDVSCADVVSALYPCHERLGHEINPLVMRRPEYDRRRQDQSFVIRVLRVPILPRSELPMSLKNLARIGCRAGGDSRRAGSNTCPARWRSQLVNASIVDRLVGDAS